MTNRAIPVVGKLAILFSWAAILSGCGESGPSPVKVTGVVTLDGKPVEGAVVSYLPDPASPGARPAEALTGADGSYRPETDGRTGVIPGKYHIVVTKAPPLPESVAKDEALKDDPYMAQLSAGMLDSRAKKPAGTIDASFDREVTAEGGAFDLDVNSKAAPAK
ncbi:carboxypeptidase-like regulatory domain-containing protein [Tundrisphaera sp. TA3]|uniref:carboxypeptidase-like regulatory domain-containing protein n=1 Tax=Tundrisphaera sp. TA3 TaxID=3435775 RepID=UPI003EBFBC2E